MKKEAVNQEFTEEMGMEQNLLETLLNSMPNPVFYKDRKGIFKGCNGIFEKQILGLPKEGIIGHTLRDLIEKIVFVFSRTFPGEGPGLLAENLENCHRKDLELLEKGASEIKEVDFLCADGITRTFLANRTSYFSPEGEVLGMVCILQDITAIKQAQENTKKSEARYRTIADQTGQLLLEEYVKTGKINWTGAIERITGYTPEEFKNIDRYAFSGLIHPDDRKKVLGKLYQSYESGERFNGEFRLRRKEGTYTHLEGSAVFLKDSEECVFRSLGVLKDISESKLAREELKKSEERFLTVAEYTGQLVFDYDLLSGKNNCVGAIENLTGYSPEEYKAFDIRYWTEHVHPEDREHILGVHKKFLETGEMQRVEYRFKKKDGMYIDVEDQVVGLKDERGKVCRILGTMKDVTERNLALKRLEKSEEKYRLLAEQAGKIVFDINLNTWDVEWTGAVKEMTGYSVEEFSKLSHRSLGELVHPEDREKISINVSLALYRGENFAGEYRFKRKDGKYIYVEHSTVCLYDDTGKPYRALGVLKDITENRLAQGKLKKSEERFRIATEQTMHIVYDYDIDNNINEWLGAIPQLTGYTVEEFQKINISGWSGHIHPDDRTRAVEAHYTALESNSMYHEVYRLRRKDGSYFYAEDSGVFLKNEEGKIHRMVGVIRDITERRLAEEELARSEERYRLIAERTGLLLYHENYAEGRVDVGGAIRGVMGYNSDDAAKFCEEEWIRLVHPDDRKEVEALHGRCKKEGGSFHAEYRMRRKDGTYFYAEDEGVYLVDENGQVCKAVGVIKDITEKKEAKEALAKIEEVRKKEIHHRIKNNLQVISSLLSLQADHFEDRKVKEAFMESQDRVISMSLIHEELYKSVDLETLDFIAYLRKLTGELLSSYSLDSSRIKLIMNTEEHIYLGMDCAIPLGMIVNELVTNSLKHAFPEEREGEIRIEFNRTLNSPTSSKSFFTLVVSDNGSGFSEKIDFENSDTLGFQLVNALVKQIEGEVEVKRNHGTEFRIRF